MGRGAMRPIWTLIRSGRERRGHGVLVGVLIGAVTTVGVGVLATVVDRPGIAAAFYGAIAWLLIELVVRIWWNARRTASGWRVADAALAGWIAIWVRQEPGRTWRRGVAADELAKSARYDPELSPLKKAASKLIREALVISSH